MAEENAAAQADAGTAADDVAPGGAGAPQQEAATDWKAEYEKAIERSRKWESRSKANAEKAKRYDEMAARQTSDAELAEAATKRAEEAEARVAEMERRAERAGTVAEVAENKGVDAELLSRMAGDTREEIEANADLIAERTGGRSIYPSVPDGGRQSPAPMTREQIEAIKDPRERVRTRARHLNLYQ